jgi:hypothetical protein
MGLNFEKICRFCMIQDDKLPYIFENEGGLIKKIHDHRTWSEG